MDKSLSTLLDLSRFLSASLVFFHHAEQILKDNRLTIIASFGHDAVVFFFILSGFVIGYVTSHKETKLIDYAIARVSRIYSVALPSIIIVLLLYTFGYYLGINAYADYKSLDWAKIIFSGLLFLNQSILQFNNIPTNGPYWSICYEVWYYILFGIYYYLPNSIYKYMLLLLSLFTAGIKILILFPIWISGYFLFTIHKKLPRNALLGIAISIFSFVIYITMRASNFDDTIYTYTTSIIGGEYIVNSYLGYSKRFAPDYLIAALFLLIIMGAYMSIDIIHKPLKMISQEINVLSSYTFSLYLYHYPLLIFFSYTIIDSTFAMIISAVIVFALGTLTERYKPAISYWMHKKFI